MILRGIKVSASRKFPQNWHQHLGKIPEHLFTVSDDLNGKKLLDVPKLTLGWATPGRAS